MSFFETLRFILSAWRCSSRIDLGSTYLSIFKNDLRIFSHCSIQVYADDTINYASQSSSLNQEYLVHSCTYVFIFNRLLLNQNKTRPMLFCLRTKYWWLIWGFRLVISEGYQLPFIMVVQSTHASASSIKTKAHLTNLIFCKIFPHSAASLLQKPTTCCSHYGVRVVKANILVWWFTNFKW